MAEPTLSQTFDTMELDIAQELGYGRDYTKWTTNQTLEIKNVINSGYSRFLFLATDPRTGLPYRWSFLTVDDTLTVFGITTGPVTGVPVYDGSTYTAVTTTGDKFYPSMVGQSIVFTATGNSYVIYSYTSSTVVNVIGNASGEASGDTFTITPDGDCALPYDFGSISGDFYLLNSNNRVKRITRRGIGQIFQLRAENPDDSGTPEVFAVSAITTDGIVNGQRQKIMFYPIPDAVATLSYQFNVLSQQLNAAKKYHRGTEQFAEVIRYAALAEVERRIGKVRGYEQMFQQFHAIAVQQDAQNAMPDSLGYNHDNSVRNTSDVYDRTYGATITRNGTAI